jgi:hypothetical protein
MKAKLKYLRSRFRRGRYAELLVFASKIVAFIIGGVAIGLVSAWYMLERGTPLTTRKIGPWSAWIYDGDIGADPYTLAHMSRSGRLPITSSNALYFMADEDSDGDDLATDCDYEISGKPLDADWWSIALYNRNGELIGREPSGSYASSSTILRRSDGGYVINIAQKMRPGNWIGISDDEEFVLLLRLYGIHASKDTKRANSIEQNLPVIRRLDCR